MPDEPIKEEPTEDAAAPTKEVPTEPAEAVPPLGQEQETPKEEPSDSGAPEVEDEAPELDVRAEKLEILKSLQEDDPDLVKEAFGEQDQSVDADRLKFNAEQSQGKRMAAFTQAQGAFNAYVPQNGQNSQAQERLYNYFETQNELVAEAAKSLSEGKLDNPGDVSLDTVKMVQAVSPLINEAVAAATSALNAANAATFYTALEQSDAYAILNAEERTAFAASEAKQSFADAALVLASAAQRSAPEAITRAAEKKAQEQAGVLEKFAKLRNGVGSGTSVTGSPSKKSGEPKTLDDIDEALRTGPTDKIDGLLKKREALVG